MIKTIIEKLRADFSSISQIGEVYSYPEIAPKAFPNIIYYPTALTSQYHTQVENMKAVSFVVFISHESKTLGLAKTWTEIMPESVQAVMDKIDAEWDGGILDGSRVWYTLETGDWTMSSADGSTVENVTARLILTIRYINQI